MRFDKRIGEKQTLLINVRSARKPWKERGRERERGNEREVEREVEREREREREREENKGRKIDK